MLERRKIAEYGIEGRGERKSILRGTTPAAGKNRSVSAKAGGSYSRKSGKEENAAELPRGKEFKGPEQEGEPAFCVEKPRLKIFPQ